MPEQCEYDGCTNDAKYALFRLYPNLTKKWGHFCDEHDEMVASNSLLLKRLNRGKVFTEVAHG